MTFIELILLCGSTPFSYAQEGLSYDLSYFEDKNGELSISQVQTKSFIPSHKGIQSFGINNTPYWFKLRIRPTEEQFLRDWWVKIDYPPLDYIDYYLFDDEDRLIESTPSGELRPFSSRGVSTPSFIHQLPLSKAAEHTLYIKVQTEGALQVPLSLINSRTMVEEQHFSIIIAGIYYGLVIIIILYNGVLFVYTRDNNYLFYLLFANSFVFWQLSLDGIGVAYIWTHLPWLTEHASILSTSFLSFSSILFSRHFLQTEEYAPKMDLFLKYLMYFSFLLTLAATVGPYHYIVKIDGLLSIIVPVFLLSTGVLIYKKGYRPARFYIIGWFIFLIGCILFSLNKFDLIGGFYLMNHAQQIGSAVEMIMLSWALGDRIKSIQDDYLNKVNNLNSTLQKNLETALLKERNKDRIMIQQSRFAALGEMIEQIAHQWRQPLNTLALINQNLYFKFKLDKFDENAFDKAHDQIDTNLQYMSQTIDDFRNFYSNTPRTETYALVEVIHSALSLSGAMIQYAKINISISNAQNPYVHNRRNELIQVCMNLIKNAHDALLEIGKSERTIGFSIHSDKKRASLSIEDNAGGVDKTIIDKIFNPYFTTKPESQGTGIGLYMSKSIVEERLNGTLHVENTSEGARFTIILPEVNPEDSTDQVASIL